MLARIPGPACAPRTPPTGPKTISSPAFSWGKTLSTRSESDGRRQLCLDVVPGSRHPAVAGERSAAFAMRSLRWARIPPPPPAPFVPRWIPSAAQVQLGPGEDAPRRTVECPWSTAHVTAKAGRIGPKTRARAPTNRRPPSSSSSQVLNDRCRVVATGKDRPKADDAHLASARAAL